MIAKALMTAACMVTFGLGCQSLLNAEPKNPQVVLETNKGTVVIVLFTDKAPITSKNFLDYVDAGYYDGTVFHRVVPGFVLQGGGYTSDLQPKSTRAPIKNEADNGLKNHRGTLSMARTNVVDSATSQFFMNLVDNSRLDHKAKTPQGYGYAVFGEVLEGMEVVDSIAKVSRRCPSTLPPPCSDAGLPPGMQDVPSEPVVIKKAYRKQN